VTHGAVAGGSPDTVEAGCWALKQGGNAVDAVVAASLSACVAEPLLTGLGGSGLAMIRMDGKVELCDLFTQTPGLASDVVAAPMRVVDLDFGPKTQQFRVGKGSVAVPTLPMGLAAMHGRYGSLPLRLLATPAIRLAEQGFEVSTGFARVAELLWPIQQGDEASAAIFGREGRAIRVGEHFRNPDLAHSLACFAKEGAASFQGGSLGHAIVDALSASSRLRMADLVAYEVAWRAPLRIQYGEATISLPALPSTAGLLLSVALAQLSGRTRIPDAGGADELRDLLAAQSALEEVRGSTGLEDWLEPGFTGAFLRAHGLAPDVQWAGLGAGGPGHTTHISVIDEHGQAVSITTSLGETNGFLIPGTGMRMNNFLGEEDVNPGGATRPPGIRLITMCCPTILELGGHTHVLGSGGSARIRTAVLHGLLHLIDHRASPEEAVSAARAHLEAGSFQIEINGRPPGTLDALVGAHPDVRTFEGASVYFGGLHIASWGPQGLGGHGDARRSGSVGIV
jgi:gamma-glutamyltranspeptidase/glutathione hydrolase